MRRSLRSVARVAVAVAAALALAAACGGDDATTPAAGGPTTTSPDQPATTAGTATTETTAAAQPAVSGRITVFAAASLTDAFREIGDAFGAAHPNTDVQFNFAASSALAGQIIEGAPADVFASADMANMTRVIAAGAAQGEPEVFATNQLAIAVAKGNPQGITGLADLARADLAVILCAQQVPSGRFAAEVLGRAGIDATPRSFEENVRAVLTKVDLGEADAGIVYVTDVRIAGDSVDGVDIPVEQNALARYPITVTGEAPNPDGAAAFVEFVRGPEGQAILARYGFGRP